LRRSRFQCNVRPRYTGGSPALVDLATAQQVAASEMRSHGDALEGIHGEAHQERAQRLGLRGIAEQVKETRKGWEVVDLITGEQYLRPFNKLMTKNGFIQWHDVGPRIREMISKVEPVMAKEATKDSRNIWFLDVQVHEFWRIEAGQHTPCSPPGLIWEPKVKEAHLS